jgi:outer membrane lipoprotein SlyB
LNKEILMRTNLFMLVAATLAALLMAACGTTASGGAGSPSAATTSSATGYGVVQAIDVVPREHSSIGLGAVAGAVVGGILGNQIGGGTGRDVATVAGVAGGAYAGHQMEKKSRSTDQVYRVAVRMDNGSVQTLMQEVPPGVQVGQRVRLDNGVIIERFR